MPVMGIGMQQPDRYRLHTLSLYGCRQRHDSPLIQGDQHISVDGHAFGNHQAQMPGHQGRGAVDIEVVMVETLFVALLNHVAETIRSDEGRGSTFAFDQSIGGECCAMNENAHIRSTDARFCNELRRPLQHRKLRRMGGR